PLEYMYIGRAGGEKGGADAAADAVELVSDARRDVMIARDQHGPHRAPGIRRRIVLFDRSKDVMRARWMNAVLGHAFERRRAARNVELAVEGRGSSGAALARHRRERLPFVGGRVVFPRVVDRIPCRRSL